MSSSKVLGLYPDSGIAGWEYGPWINWLWAWENPHPEKKLQGIRFEPQCGTVIVSAVSRRRCHGEHPLRWQRRQKAVFFLPAGEDFQARPG
jgi:hypothetical protein